MMNKSFIPLAVIVSVCFLLIISLWGGGRENRLSGNNFYAEKVYQIDEGLLPGISHVMVYVNSPIIFCGDDFISSSGKILCVAYLSGRPFPPVDTAFGDKNAIYQLYSPDGEIHLVAVGLPAGRTIFGKARVITVKGPILSSGIMSADGPYNIDELSEDKVKFLIKPFLKSRSLKN